MNELSKTKLFILLSDPSQESTNNEMQNAYGSFMEQIEIVSQSENDYSEVFRMLNFTRIELVFLESIHQYEQEKKCSKIRLSSKSTSTS